MVIDSLLPKMGVNSSLQNLKFQNWQILLIRSVYSLGVIGHAEPNFLALGLS